MTHRLSFDHLDPLYLVVNLLHKAICRQHAINILQERLDRRVDLSNGSLRIEKYLARITPQTQICIFGTAALKRIEIPPCIKRIERTNKDDNGRIQAVIVRARCEQVNITSLLLFYEFLG